MRSRLALIAILALPALATPGAQIEPIILDGQRVHPTRILARLRDGVPPPARQAALGQHGLKAFRQPALVPRLLMLDEDEQHPAFAANAANPAGRPARLGARLAALRASGLFEYVEPDHARTLNALPTDAAFTNGTLWGLRNTGQNGGVPGADIGAVGAWAITNGSTNVIVAVIDSGIRYTHQDLTNNMWRNPGESGGGKESNGLDDDGDGYIDNVFGINSIMATNMIANGVPVDDVGHGTHVAGTIGAVANNAGPHVGVASNVRLMACKLFQSTDERTAEAFTSDEIECINFAVAKGAKIINASYGGNPGSETLIQAEYDAIQNAGNQGVLFVAAAGNDGRIIDNSPLYSFWPAKHDLNNIIAVAALNRVDQLARFSNFGSYSVDVAAPGADILSCWNGSDTDYRTISGTSMATPHVTGIAALIRSYYPNITVSELRQRIFSGAIPVSGLQGWISMGARVNAERSLLLASDNTLEITVAPADTAILSAGATVAVFARVTDLAPITNATVIASVTGGGSFTLLDDGIAPDVLARDGTYSASWNVPAPGSAILTVTATMPGKIPATHFTSYQVLAPPANDNFSAAISLTGITNLVTASNVTATREVGEPDHGNDSAGHSVWWSWTAPANGFVTLSTEGSSFDTLLAAYTGNNVSVLSLVEWNDEDVCLGTSSRMTFPVVVGTIYRIAVDGFRGVTGNIALSVVYSNTRPAPINDNFADRLPLDGTNLTVTACTAESSIEPGESKRPGLLLYGGSVWWKWTAPTNGLLRFHLQEFNFVSVITVSTGASCGGPRSLDHSTQKLSFCFLESARVVFVRWLLCV